VAIAYADLKPLTDKSEIVMHLIVHLKRLLNVQGLSCHWTAGERYSSWRFCGALRDLLKASCMKFSAILCELRARINHLPANCLRNTGPINIILT
jgi:hypothetical protein